MDEGDQDAEGPPVRIVATAAAAGTAVAVAAAATALFEAPAFAVAVAAAMAVGTALHLPYFLRLEADGGPRRDAWHDVHPGAAGLGLEVGGVVAFALAFVLGAGVQPLEGGLGVALVAYLGLAAVLPRAPGEAGEEVPA